MFQTATRMVGRVTCNLQLYLCDEDLYTIAIHDAYEPTDHDHP